MGSVGCTFRYAKRKKIGAAANKQDAIDLLRKAFETGITFFDTAEAYGPFDNEESLGEALESFRKEKKFIDTESFESGTHKPRIF